MYPAQGDGGMGKLPASAWCVLVLQALKLLLAWQLPLFGDEAFYWLESREPAPAHDDVPGLVPWLIALSTAAFGEGPLALRLPGLLLSWLTLGVLYRSARMLADPDTAWRCLLLASLPPLMAMNGTLMLPDVGVNVAVVLALFGAQRALSGELSGRWWLALGIGLGVLAHYRFAVPLAAAALVLIAMPALRGLLRWALLWPALLALAVALAPLGWHLLVEHGQGLAFQFVERHPLRFQGARLADPLLQAMVVSPLLYGLLLWAGWRSRRGSAALQVWAGWGLALLLLFWIAGVFADSERSRLHWPAPAYLALSLPLALAWSRVAVWLRRATLSLGALVCLAGSGYLIAVAWLPERLSGTPWYPDNFLGAARLADALSRELAELDPQAPLIVDHFLLAAQLEHVLTLQKRPRALYVLDHPLNAKHGRQAVLARLGRDARALPTAHPPGLLLVDLAALPLRQRGRWLWRLCQRFPQAEWLGERWFDHGHKRYAVYRLPAPGSPPRCAPPLVGYIDLIEGAAMDQAGTVGGWALAGGVGVDELRLLLDERPLTVDWPIPLPSLIEQLGETGDPDMPAVGWQARLPTHHAPGRRWLRLEARSAGRDWHPLTAVSIRLSGGAAVPTDQARAADQARVGQDRFPADAAPGSALR